jgi:hypothetical protein
VEILSYEIMHQRPSYSVGYRDDDALGFGLIGCVAGYAQFPLLHDTLQASLRRGFFYTEIEKRGTPKPEPRIAGLCTPTHNTH